jgi:hypothetical protein
MILAYRDRPVQPLSPSRLKRQLVTLGLYGLMHDHSQRWAPAITTIIRDRGWAHE